ncbi:DUF4157 domain-containing protein [Nocardia sp. BMG111209]|uniref:WXG100-like domain-containing protein n=1 Tax=Nocardia sp. BMG111209 TaxID=1160137 RepID=UPI000376E4E4|nr:DUF4157 domain-containing protein [Nocardia sp. BMG111209]
MATPTVPVIVHRADEYHSAGEIFGQIATDATITHSSLAAVLTNYAGMAGDDSVGRQWATSYDETADLAISTSAALAIACGQIRDLIIVGAHNHHVTETTADHRDLPAPAAPALTPEPCLPQSVPSAAGHGIPEPFGWSIIRDAVGLTWPDGHQDQLHSAATAWHTASSDYRTLAGEIPSAVALLGNQQSPEIDTAVTTCRDRQTDLTALADACRALGDGCNTYAQHLDDAHRKILDELSEFAAETVAAETVFAVLTPFTASVSEWVGNTAMAARVAVKARRIATVITELATKAAEIVTDVIKPLAERLKPLLEKVRRWVDAVKTKFNPFARRAAVMADGRLFSRMGSRTNREILDSGDHLPMTQQTIEEYARRAGVDLRGVRVDVAGSADDVRYFDTMQASASTAPGHIALAPSAFADEETLMRNLVHERVHIDQYADGRVGSSVTRQLEDEAYTADEEFWNRYTAGSQGG